MQGTRKCIEVRSEFIVVNQSALDLQLLFNKPGERYAMSCSINETVPVPIDYCQSQLGILPTNEIDIEGWTMIELS